MRCGAFLVVASLFVQACAEGEKNVDFIPPDAAADAVAEAATDASDAVEETCVPPGGAKCAVLPQCGCGPTQNCNVTSPSGETSCVAAGTDGLHESCGGGAGDCQKGMQCVAGVCVPFCSTDADCTTPGSPRCKSVQGIDALKVCHAQCDVQSPAAACGPNAGCFFPTLGDDTTACTGAGVSTSKGGCTANKYACAPGYACFNSADCFKWCRVGTSGDCFGGQTCTSFTPKAMKGTVEYGVCVF